MTGHHRLQEQLTPPHKHLCVQTSHSFSHSLHWFLSHSVSLAHALLLKGTALHRSYILILFKHKPSLEDQGYIQEPSLVTFVSYSTLAARAAVNTLFTSQLEKLLKTRVGRVDVYLSEGEERKLCI